MITVPDCTFVYTLLLEDDHELLVNGVGCITWGHNSADPCLSHAFFGSDKVVRALEGMRGFSQGFVRLGGCIRAGNPQKTPRQVQEQDDDPIVGLLEAATHSMAMGA